MGYKQYALHTELNVSLVDTQQSMTPIQRNFLLYAEKYHGPDTEDLPDTPTSGNTTRTTDVSKMKEWE